MQRSAVRTALQTSSLLALLLHAALSCGAPDLLLCRSCGHEVAPETDLTSIISPLTLSYRNATLAGGRKAVVQLLENPQGFRFEVIAAKKADVLKHWPADARTLPGFRDSRGPSPPVQDAMPTWDGLSNPASGRKRLPERNLRTRRRPLWS